MTARLVCVLVLALACANFGEEPKFRVGPSALLTEPGKKQAPAEAQQIANRALAAFSKGDLATARKDFLKVLELVPGNVPTTINLGLLEYRAKKFAEAEKLLKTVLKSEPESGLAWLILGVIYYDQDKLDAALGALAQAVYFEPKDARAHHYLGVTIGRKGWYSGAEDEMRKAIALAPDYAEAHFNLAVFYLQRTPPAVELARRHYQQALDLGAAPDPEVAKQFVTP
jgi:Tfp pilus assembly protein PilF